MAKQALIHPCGMKFLPLSERSGPLRFTLRNDYLFKAVLQSNEEVLRSLICSLLRLKPQEIVSVEITNPIILGSSILGKDIVLDIRILLNGSRLVNLELQVINEGDWTERSLIYLCRLFNNVQKGKPYLSVLPSHHIGILDFSLKHLSAEFYGHFYMMNERTHEIFSDKMCLSVLNLKQIDLATDEDKKFGLDKWAALFKAATWEELKMLTAKDNIYETVADTIYTLSEDERIQEQCRLHQELIDQAEWKNRYIRRLEKAIQEKDNAIQERDNAIQEKDNAIQEKDNAIREKNNVICERDAAICEKDDALQKQASRIAELEKALSDAGYPS